MSDTAPDAASGPPRIAIALVRQLDAAAALVFEACTDPRRLARWLTPGAGEVRDATCGSAAASASKAAIRTGAPTRCPASTWRSCRRGASR
ncbi:hypothetical protein [Methylobacterium sp. yr668]|uniref:hypothetical protein n=1 Tax=Methylobacterium sp. yr668 TaxID=1761801 RepID=UPI0008EC1A71|nr:hypothetical protein [Methylobacterium sp. yr668]SFT22768.1 hypothetical protein SAMN04487845_12732 [Methylobacterium sp. yr668]